MRVQLIFIFFMVMLLCVVNSFHNWKRKYWK